MLNKLDRTWLSQKFDRDEKIIFVHVPKCGGTSLDSLIRKKFLFNRFKVSAGASAKTSSNMNKDVQLVRSVLLNYAVCLDYKYISGHFYMHHPEQFEDYKIITLLRDPAARFVSHYLYNRYKTHSKHDIINMEFDDFLASDLAIDYGNLICRYFSKNKTANESIATLNKFSKVATLDNLTPLVDYLEDELKISGDIKKKNRSPISGENISQELQLKYKDRISQICSTDIEVYNYFSE